MPARSVGIRPFDPFPFPFLTMTVSLEAIFLALFVLASQNRLTRQADKRSHLDLQIDLLAEREMTAVLQLLQDIASTCGADQRHAGAVARLDEEDGPSTTHESDGGTGGAGHVSTRDKSEASREDLKAASLSAAVRANSRSARLSICILPRRVQYGVTISV